MNFGRITACASAVLLMAAVFVFSALAQSAAPANLLKKGLKLLWVGIGKDDFLLNSSRSAVDLLKKRGFAPISRETEGGHTWINWRNYLNEFAPQLFQTKTAM